MSGNVCITFFFPFVYFAFDPKCGFSLNSLANLQFAPFRVNDSNFISVV